jgi:hypothetical protein
MISRKLLLAAVCLTATAAAMAGARSLERPMETTTEAVSLPESLPGSIDARGCLTCQSMRLEVPATARLFVGTDAVTIKELRQFSLGKRYNMTIFYELDRPVVRRIVVEGVLPKRVAQ